MGPGAIIIDINIILILLLDDGGGGDGAVVVGVAIIRKRE